MTKVSVKKKSKTCTVVEPKQSEGNGGWIESHGIEVKKGMAILFKRVSSDFKTQEDTVNETTWTIGTTLVHKNPDLESEECGSGKFHFCARPYFCDEFRSKAGDRYIALSVPIASIHAWPNAQYPHKIAGTEATVLYECDRFGNKIQQP